MLTLLRDLRDALISLKLTVVLIALSIVLILAATLDQVNIGVWAVQEKYFHAFAVFLPVGKISLAVFPGGYSIGGFLLINLIGAHLYRFKLTARKSGIHLVHSGLILLLVGELLSGIFQDEYQMRLDEGQTKNFSESYRNVELAIIETTNPKFDDVIAVPERMLARKETVQNPRLPFRVMIKSYLPNSMLQMRVSAANAKPSPATSGIGAQIIATAQPLTYKQDERNLPSAFIELTGPDGPIGTWLVSTQLTEPQRFDYGGRSW